MLRRLLLGVALIAAFSSLGSAVNTPAAVEASPAFADAQLYISDHSSSDYERVEFSKGERVIWANLTYDGVGRGANLSYILRLNGWDYKWGDLKVGKNGSGNSVSFSLFNKDHDGKAIPGGAYTVLVYDGDVEIARAGFGVKGGKGSDNDNDH